VRIYETTFVINPQSDDATIDKHVKDIQEIITSTDGKIIHEDNMGTRRLAYEIKGLTQGYYASFLYEAPAEVLPKLHHHFKVNEAFIRDLTIRIEVDPAEVIKQTDPFGKHGSDKRDHDNNDDDRPSYGDRKAARRDSDEKAEPVKESPAVPKEEASISTDKNDTDDDKPAEEL